MNEPATGIYAKAYKNTMMNMNTILPFHDKLKFRERQSSIPAGVSPLNITAVSFERGS